MPEELNEPMTPHDAFLFALNELVEGYIDSVLQDVRTADEEWVRAVATGYEPDRAAAIQELRSYAEDTHDLASCRSSCCVAIQIIAKIWWTPLFGRS